MERVRGRTEQDRRLEAQHDVGARLRIHAAAGNARQAHLGERHLDAPRPDMGTEAGDHEDGIAFAEVHRMHRPRIGPRPELAVDVAVAEDARRAGAAGGREHHPAALGPDPIVHRGEGAVRRIGRRILHHLGLVEHRPLGDEVVDTPDVRRDEAEPVEAAAIEGAVLVEKRRDGGDLAVLDGAQLVARGGVELGRPVAVGARPIAVMAMPLDRLEPHSPRRLRAPLIRHGPMNP